MADGFEQARNWPREAWTTAPDGCITHKAPMLMSDEPYRVPGTGKGEMLIPSETGGFERRYVDYGKPDLYIGYWYWLLCGKLMVASFHYVPGDDEGNERRKQVALDELIRFVGERLEPASIPDGVGIMPTPSEAASVPQEARQ